VTSPSVALIDYHAGNLTSVKKALAAVGAKVFVPAAPEDLAEASAVIVPGVGHFDATRALGPAWVDAILQRVGEGRPLFGICLGMQWLYEGSEEAPEVRGLGVLSGECRRLRPPAGSALKIPHVGWNSIDKSRDASIMEGVGSGAQAYFTHSYVAPITGDTVASTDHGEAFASVVQRGQVAGVQFHPEKSGEVGLQILRNWLRQAA
jgi:imidazole glycerol-phosphate synthase subunit HisH